MADRFPSLEDFDSGAQTDVKDASADASTSNFLERERALLGEDAGQFVSVADAGIAGEDDLLGGDGGDGGGSGMLAKDVAFESQFPELQPSNEAMAPGGTMTGGPSVTYNSGYNAFVSEQEDEPEVIKEWRVKRDAKKAERAEKLAQQRAETVAEAQRNIDEFYESYNNKRDKTIAQTRREADQFLEAREDTTSGGTSWERIAKIVDVSGKGPKGGAAGSGKERFREVLMSLRKDENAPGASGI